MENPEGTAPTGSGGNVVDVRDVRKVYGKGHTETIALHGATLHVRPNEFVALLGPSGSGKTTLLSIIGALLTPTEGVVEVAGRDIAGLNAKEQTQFRSRSIGFVFQSFNLVPFLTAKENLLVAAQYAGEAKATSKERAKQLLHELGLDERADQLPRQLSGGERQRVAIGRALMNDPDVILVDEPTANLDTRLGHAVCELLATEIRSRGKAGIMVTHDHRMVDYTDRTYEILDGIVTDTSTAEPA